MPIEIEHKFLLVNDDWRKLVEKTYHYWQGYLSSTRQNSVRIRVADTKAWINIKSAVVGTHRLEYEYDIPVPEAKEILEQLCHKPLIEKYRHIVTYGQHVWEIDEFLGDNLGLIVAEVELAEKDEKFVTPSWIGQDVTHDLRYYNNFLSQNPYNKWIQHK